MYGDDFARSDLVCHRKRHADAVETGVDGVSRAGFSHNWVEDVERSRHGAHGGPIYGQHGGPFVLRCVDWHSGVLRTWPEFRHGPRPCPLQTALVDNRRLRIPRLLRVCLDRREGLHRDGRLWVVGVSA
jgi:hypothetical protein